MINYSRVLSSIRSREHTSNSLNNDTTSEMLMNIMKLYKCTKKIRKKNITEIFLNISVIFENQKLNFTLYSLFVIGLFISLFIK